MSFVIGQNDYFGFSFTLHAHSIENLSIAIDQSAHTTSSRVNLHVHGTKGGVAFSGTCTLWATYIVVNCKLQ